jgi:hypothetical protein
MCSQKITLYENKKNSISSVLPRHRRVHSVGLHSSTSWAITNVECRKHDVGDRFHICLKYSLQTREEIFSSKGPVILSNAAGNLCSGFSSMLVDVYQLQI